MLAPSRHPVEAENMKWKTSGIDLANVSTLIVAAFGKSALDVKVGGKSGLGVTEGSNLLCMQQSGVFVPVQIDNKQAINGTHLDI